MRDTQSPRSWAKAPTASSGKLFLCCATAHAIRFFRIAI
jgi:hypothetical protein